MAAEHNDHQLYVVSKILDASYKLTRDVSRVVSRVVRIPRWRGHLGTIHSYGCRRSGDCSEVHRASE
jgi:hypothetical protein